MCSRASRRAARCHLRALQGEPPSGPAPGASFWLNLGWEAVRPACSFPLFEGTELHERTPPGASARTFPQAAPRADTLSAQSLLSPSPSRHAHGRHRCDACMTTRARAPPPCESSAILSGRRCVSSTAHQGGLQKESSPHQRGAQKPGARVWAPRHRRPPAHSPPARLRFLAPLRPAGVERASVWCECPSG